MSEQERYLQFKHIQGAAQARSRSWRQRHLRNLDIESATRLGVPGAYSPDDVEKLDVVLGVPWKEVSEVQIALGARGRVVARDLRITGPVPLSYDDFKAEIEAVREDIKQAVIAQGRDTREEICSSRQEILAAIKLAPTEYVKLMCELAALLFAFSLAIRFALGIELVKPAFAIFMLFSFSIYWLMAWTHQKSSAKRLLEQK
jgi:hypothetical protein